MSSKQENKLVNQCIICLIDWYFKIMIQPMASISKPKCTLEAVQQPVPRLYVDNTIYGIWLHAAA